MLYLHLLCFCVCVSLDFSQRERIYEKNIELQESYTFNFAKITQTAKGSFKLETIAPGLFIRRAINRINIFVLQNVHIPALQNLNQGRTQ